VCYYGPCAWHCYIHVVFSAPEVSKAPRYKPRGGLAHTRNRWAQSGSYDRMMRAVSRSRISHACALDDAYFSRSRISHAWCLLLLCMGSVVWEIGGGSWPDGPDSPPLSLFSLIVPDKAQATKYRTRFS